MRNSDKSVFFRNVMFHIYIGNAANSGMKVDYAIDESVRGSSDISCIFLFDRPILPHVVETKHRTPIALAPAISGPRFVLAHSIRRQFGLIFYLREFYRAKIAARL